ncbi:response regulator [Nonomuraea spiralis]|uniref:Response regulator n=1 Tax=Nonomuraea spiralis TaxID=46182 RepID=A0ABV5ISP1_9ACTN|nr:response regulator transcription factor [Nonomuraea spiralis]GGT08704.1 DNA-binding response regulator [Nonomuraea spiralis]
MRREGSIDVLIADDHTILRETLKQTLELEPDLCVVATAGDARATVTSAEALRPDVVVLDVEMPGDGVVRTTKHIHRVSPRSRVIVLSMYDDPVLVQELIAHGVRGYLLKSVGREELVQAIRGVCADAERVVLSVSRESLMMSRRPRAGKLSERELSVLSLAAQGLSNAQIGTRLMIAEGTVKRHLRNIFTKLDATSRLDAVNKAMAASLLTL